MGAPVTVNVYDLHDNSWIYWCGIGIYHSGIEVYGVEYAYGGHEYDMSGVFATNPRDAPGPVVWRESVIVGETNMDTQEVQEVVQQMGNEYRGNAYHLLERNCNHFSDELAFKLTGNHAPQWINRLAGLAIMLHCLLPPSWVPPLTPPSAKMLEAERGVEERQNLLQDSTMMERSSGSVH